MRIGIDAHQIGTQLAGNATYITNLVEALAEIDRKNQYTLYVTEPEIERRYAEWRENFSVRRIVPHNPFIRIPFALNVELRRRPVDILFVQYNAPPLAPCRVVAAIHDISYEHLPETYRRRERFQMRLTIRHTAKKAAHVVACSEFSRQDLIETYQLPPEKITAIPLAAPEFFKPVRDFEQINQIRRKYDLSGDFILGVGSIQPRKNLVRLIEAYSILVRRNDATPPLVLVGKKAWLFEETLKAASAEDITELIRFTGFVPDEDLPALYTAAQFFVYPSFFEGFGLPPLEAMRCGTPVIAGNRTSIPEVVGDAGLLIDPFDTNAIANALEKLISDENLRAELSRKGLRRAEQFSWLETARRTLEVFEKAAK